MKTRTKIAATAKRDPNARLPEIFHHNRELFAKELKRKLASLKFIIDEIDDPDLVIPSSIDHAHGEIDWNRIESATWSQDCQLAIQWMKSIWTEKMHVVSDSIHGAWPTEFDLRVAIFLALANDAHLKYMIDPYYWMRKSRSGELACEGVA